MSVRKKKNIYHFPLKAWEVGGRNEKDADANFEALKSVVESYFDEENRNMLGFQGDQAVVNKSWLEKVGDFHLFDVLSGQCANHGGHIAKLRGNNRLLLTIDLDNNLERRPHNSDDFDHLFWFEGEKEKWEKNLKIFFSFLAHLSIKPDRDNISFGAAIHHFKLKLQRLCQEDVNPYRNFDRERKMEKLFGPDYKMKEKESTEKLIVNSDKKKRKMDQQIDQLAASLLIALKIARTDRYKQLFPGIDNFEFDTFFIKFINEYGVEGRKLLSIMDSSKDGQDGGLVRQMFLCVDLMTDCNNYPLDNAAGR